MGLKISTGLTSSNKKTYLFINLRAPQVPFNIKWDNPHLDHYTKGKQENFPKTLNELDGKPIKHEKE
jgi:hypothetical protein